MNQRGTAKMGGRFKFGTVAKQKLAD